RPRWLWFGRKRSASGGQCDWNSLPGGRPDREAGGNCARPYTGYGEDGRSRRYHDSSIFGARREIEAAPANLAVSISPRHRHPRSHRHHHHRCCCRCHKETARDRRCDPCGHEIPSLPCTATLAPYCGMDIRWPCSAHPPLSLIKKRRRTRLATILICGSPADGFQIIGLFADRDDARSYAEALMRTRRRRRRLILLRAQDPSRPLAQRPTCPIPRPFSAAPSPGG